MRTERHTEVLLVEDDEDDLELALRALKSANLSYPIHVSRDGLEALDFIFCERAYAHRTIDQPPKVVVLDLKLPRVDGLEVLKRIKSDPRTKSIPVVMLSSSGQVQDVHQSYELGANAYVVKPINFEQFTATVQQLGLFWLRHNQCS